MKANKRIYALFLIAILIGAFCYRVFADNVGCAMHNKSSSAITFSVDGSYGCRAEAGDTCSFTTTTGSHSLKAMRSDNSKSITITIDVSANGYDWTVSDSSDWQ